MSQIVEAFSRLAEDYDRWYEGNPLFESECLAVEAMGEVPHPSLEVGAGTGRFAARLGLDFGLDPSLEMLRLARKRGVAAVCGRAEELPFGDGTLAGVYFLFAFCFLEDQEKALSEARRVLGPEGLLVLGIINRASAWGRLYQEKAASGHPLYRWARFLTPEELVARASSRGFAFKRAVSTLFQSPQAPPQVESPREGVHPAAGFVVLSFTKT